MVITLLYSLTMLLDGRSRTHKGRRCHELGISIWLWKEREEPRAGVQGLLLLGLEMSKPHIGKLERVEKMK